HPCRSFAAARRVHVERCRLQLPPELRHRLRPALRTDRGLYQGRRARTLVRRRRTRGRAGLAPARELVARARTGAWCEQVAIVATQMRVEATPERDPEPGPPHESPKRVQLAQVLALVAVLAALVGALGPATPTRTT